MSDEAEAGARPETGPIAEARAAGQVANVHGSCVAFDAGAVLILGPSGAGKSTLALALMAIGGRLVADDRTDLSRDCAKLIADCPPALRGMIEARGIGILAADYEGPSEVTLLVDLALEEAERLPLGQERALLGVKLPLVKGPMRPHLEAMVKQLLLKGKAL